MKNAHKTERTMAGKAIDRKLELAANILEKSGLWWNPDGWLVEFHLDPSDPLQIVRIDEPFSAFTVALQEVAAIGEADHFSERVRR